MQVVGRLHPMVLHFPVTLLFLLLILEALFSFKKMGNVHTEEIITFLLALTAASSAIVALMGFLLSFNGGYEGADIVWHKWSGVSVAFLAGLLVLLKGYRRVLYRAGLFVSVIAVSVAGHYGAALTHGTDFVTEPLKSKKHEIENIDSAVVFKDLIQPLLETKCVGCHNPNKTKGDLLLTDKENILKGGEDGKILIAGSPDSSMMYSYLLLPMKDDKHMPPDGKVQLEPEEIKLIHWWIASGADFEKKYSEVDRPDSIQAIVNALYVPLSPLDKLNIDFVSEDKIVSLNNPHRGVRQVSGSKPYLDVYLANRQDIDKTTLQELDAIRQQVVSINLGNTNASDDVLKEVAKFPHLQRLYLESTQVTNEGIKTLTELKFLEYLNLSGSRIEKGVAPVLKKFPALKRVYLFDAPVASDDLQDLQKELPGVKIGFVASLTDSVYHARLGSPEVEVDSAIFAGVSTVTINGRLKGTRIYYTTDGSEPTEQSHLYSSPLKIDSSGNLKVMATLKGWENSRVLSFDFLRSAIRPVSSQLISMPDSSRMERKDTTLLDFLAGSDGSSGGRYLGYLGNDLQAIFDFGSDKTISGAGIGYLVNMGGQIMPPVGVEVWGGNNKDRLSRIKEIKIAEADSMVRGSARKILLCKFSPTAVRYVKLIVKNTGSLPGWHRAKGKKSWLFVDEVVFE